MTTAQLRAILPRETFARVTGESLPAPRMKRGERKAMNVEKARQKQAEHDAIERTLQRVNRPFLFELHCPTPNLTNGCISRNSWKASAAKKKQKKAVAEALLVFQNLRPILPAIITITRTSPQRLDEDNTGPALKAVQDSIAKWLHVDDGETEKAKFVRVQEHGEYSVSVCISPATGGQR